MNALYQMSRISKSFEKIKASFENVSWRENKVEQSSKTNVF